MRVVFIGASALTTYTAKILLDRGHDVVVIESNKERTDELATNLDCGLIHGDGSKPAILKEADPVITDYLFCLTNNDQTNIIASLVGRSLGFKHTVTRIEDEAFTHICIELGLENTIIPAQTIGHYLADMLNGESQLELAVALKHDARIFSFVATAADAKSVSDLSLPGDSQVIFLYRGNRFNIANSDTHLKEGDEVVVITHDKHLPTLMERWRLTPPSSSSTPQSTD